MKKIILITFVICLILLAGCEGGEAIRKTKLSPEDVKYIQPSLPPLKIAGIMTEDGRIFPIKEGTIVNVQTVTITDPNGNKITFIF